MAEVNLDIIVEIDKALKEVKTFGKQSTSALESVEKSFAGIKAIAAAAVAVFAADKIIDGISAIVSAASEADAEYNKMASSLKLAGDFSARNAQQFERLAESLQETTRFDDDVILGQVAIAKRFGATNVEAEKLIRAAVDLAAATGTDLNTATEMLGRTLDGTAGRLNEFIPDVRTLTAEQLAAGGAIDLVASRFAGAANNEMQTFGGAVTRTQNILGGFVEDIGKVIVNNDVVIQSIAGMSDVFKVFADVFKQNKTAIRDFISGGVIIAVESLGILVQMIRTLDQAFSKVYVGMLATAKVLSVGSAEAKKAGGLFKALKKAVSDAGSASEAFEKRDETYSKITEAVAGLSVKLADVDSTQKSINESVEETGKGFDKLKPKMGRINAEAEAAFSKLKADLENYATKQSEVLEKRFKKEKQSIIENARTEQERIELLAALQLKYDTERSEALKKEAKEREDAEKQFYSELIELTQNPIKFFFDLPSIKEFALTVTDEMRKGLAVAVGGLASLLQGKEGARRLMASAAEAAGKALLGVPGFGQIFELLSQGPDHVRAMVTQFLEAIPDLIVAVVDSLPVIIEALADKFSDPAFLEKLAKAFARAAFLSGPQMALAMVRGAEQFLSRILSGADQFIGKILEGAGKFIEELVKKIGEGISDAVSGLGKGGLGGMFGGLLSGLFPGLGSVFGGGGGGGFWGNGGGSDDSDWTPWKTGAQNETMAIPGASKALLSDGGSGEAQNLTIVVQVERQALAKTIVDLNKLGYRLA